MPLSKAKDCERNSPVRVAGGFIRLVLKLQPVTSVFSVGITLVNGVVGGCGILLLIPMLELLAPTNEAQPHVLSLGLARVIGAVGLTPTLEVIVGVFLVLVGMQSLLRRQLILVNARLQFEFGQILQNRLFESVAYCRWGFFARQRRSDFMHVLTHDLKRVSRGIVSLLNLVSALVLVVVHVAIALSVSFALSLVVLAAAAALTPFLIRLNRLAHHTGQQITAR